MEKHRVRLSAFFLAVPFACGLALLADATNGQPPERQRPRERMDLITDAAHAQPSSPEPRKLIARTYNSGFPEAHDTYNGLSSASDGRIYYVLSTDRFDVSARMFVFDPATRQIKHLGDLTEACGEKGQNTIVQGKSHVNFVDCGRQALFRHPHRLLQHHRRHGEDGHPASGLEAVSRRPLAGLRHGHRQVRRPGHRPQARGHPDLGHGHAARPALRPHLAHRPLLPLRPGQEGDEGLRRRQRGQGENGKGATYRTICRSIAVEPRRRLGLLHRRRRRDPPLPRGPRRPGNRRGRGPEEGLLRPLRLRPRPATWATTGARSSGGPPTR